MTEHSYVGYQHPTYDFTVTEDSLNRFIAAIGSQPTPATLPVAPPTYQKVIEGKDDSSRKIIEALGIELKRVLHAEQEFEYLEPITAGDQLKVSRKISDHYFKKSGTREFLVIESEVRRPRSNNSLVGKSRQVLILRQL
ncbi:FAS1-like dehydratase domain-containing protein [Marinobacter sp. NP-6]|uniref:FAS1-like dehydratase domain-containing protein n=1 Tax=Marinobacter sp. NP-6 TaxID=2488666 RepID=UPI00163B6386|nr:MaoC family dehydratase N-terminal domain-containing protein [Marinobacter sp. NP-6]